MTTNKKLTRWYALITTIAVTGTSIIPNTAFAEELTSNPITIEEYSTAEEFVDDTDLSVEDLHLIITSDEELTDFKHAASVQHYDDIYILTYHSAIKRSADYNAFIVDGIDVEFDDAIENDEDIDEDVLSDVVENAEDISTEDAESTEESVVIAVIDSGLNPTEDMANDLLDGFSVLSENSSDVTDENGHGTLVTKAILSQLADDVSIDESSMDESSIDTGINYKILPIKALDANGKGTVLSVYTAIKYAIEQDVDVINISISGAGKSNMLTNAINDAYNHGITVVVAAGNNADDATLYMPGNVDNAMTVSATDTDAEGNIVLAKYSNYGSNIDFAANGIYVYTLVSDDETEESIAVEGTSISAAYVSAYVAMLKAINTEVTETEVFQSLQQSAIDLGEEGFDESFGYGYLEKKNIVLKKDDSVENDIDNEVLDTDLEETEADAAQEVESSGSVVLLVNSSGYGQFNSWWNHCNATTYRDACAESIYSAIGWAALSGYKDIVLCIQDNASFYETGVSLSDNWGGTITFADDSYYWGKTNSPTTSSSNIYTNDSSSMVALNLQGKGGNVSLIGVGNGNTVIFRNCDLRDWTTEFISYDKSPGCVGAYNSSPYKAGTVKAYNSTFYSAHHWWSVSSGNAGTFENCTFINYNVSGQTNEGNCGALVLENGGTIKNCTFNGSRNNTNMSRALTIAGNVTITNTTIAGYGGFNPAITYYGNGTLKMDNVNVYSNSATSASTNANFVALLEAEGGTTNITNCNFYNTNCAIYCGTDSSSATVNIKSGTKIYNCKNTSTNTSYASYMGIGIYNFKKGTLNISDGSIYSNTTYGVYNKGGTVNMTGGNIYSNVNQGIYSPSGTINCTGGSIYSNTYDGIWSNGTLTLNGTTVRNNGRNGVVNQGTVTYKSGEIYSNSSVGLYNICGTISMSGGKVYSNGYGFFNYAGNSGNTNGANAIVNITNGEIYSNSVYGVYTADSKSTTNISGGTIYNNNPSNT